MSSLLAMSMPDFCRRVGIGRTCAYALIKEGKLPTIKIGKRRLVREDDAKAFVDSFIQPARAG